VGDYAGLMKIVFLDVSTLHSGELAVERLGEFGELVCYETTSAEEVTERCAGAHTVITNKVIISAEMMEGCPELKQIISCATGVNQIDVVAARMRGITVQNVAGYSTASVAQHVWGLILNLSSSIHLYDRESRNWPSYPTFSSLKFPVTELDGKVLGIIGYGEIGRRVADIGRGFGMRIQALQRKGRDAADDGIVRMAEDGFYSSSDVVSIHCPLTAENQGMIGEEVLKKMKPSALLINTARGPLVDEVALVEALRCGEIAAAGLDVLSSEPPEADNPLIQYRGQNLIITPHTAWSAREARQRLLDGLIENLRSFLDGSPANLVD